MPKKVQFTREIIVNEAIEIIRTDGIKSLTARSLCKKLGCSVAPIFRTYVNMDDLFQDVRKEANRIVNKKLSSAVDYEPAFKELGLRLVRMSREDSKLFHYVFLENDGRCNAVDALAKKCLYQSERIFSITYEQTQFIYAQIWPYMLGLAQLCCNNPDFYSDEYVSRALSTQFQALLYMVKSGQEVKDIKPCLK